MQNIEAPTDIEALLKKQDVPELKRKVQAEMCKRSYKSFVQYFWDCVSNDELIWNWHMDEIIERVEKIGHRVGKNEVNDYDVMINVPPGSSKSILATILFPIWCWVNYPDLRFMCVSYSSILALEHAEMSREVVRSKKFQELFPHLVIKKDKDQKQHFKLEVVQKDGKTRLAGGRFSTSVGGTSTGFHANLIIIDDPMSPADAESDNLRNSYNEWINRTLTTRTAPKSVASFLLIQQRLHENDTAGSWLEIKKDRLDHLCLPGEIEEGRDFVKPPELINKYVDNCLDPNRMPMNLLRKMKEELGVYGYAGQVLQNPTPAGGGMFKVGQIEVIDGVDYNDLVLVRYWDKAGTEKVKNPNAAYTCGVLMGRHKQQKYFVILDVVRGQWGSGTREKRIYDVAHLDGIHTTVYVEQEPGSGGKESAESTIKNLAGFKVYADKPLGHKVLRADPFAAQVEIGNVKILRGIWNRDFIKELEMFPLGKHKDQVDASSGAFSQLTKKKEAKVWQR